MIGDRLVDNKIDKVFIKTLWNSTWSTHGLQLVLGAMSNHARFLVHLHPTYQLRKPFRFLNSSLKIEGYTKLVEDC